MASVPPNPAELRSPNSPIHRHHVGHEQSFIDRVQREPPLAMPELHVVGSGADAADITFPAPPSSPVEPPPSSVEEEEEDATPSEMGRDGSIISDTRTGCCRESDDVERRPRRRTDQLGCSRRSLSTTQRFDEFDDATTTTPLTEPRRCVDLEAYPTRALPDHRNKFALGGAEQQLRLPLLGDDTASLDGGSSSDSDEDGGEADPPNGATTTMSAPAATNNISMIVQLQDCEVLPYNTQRLV